MGLVINFIINGIAIFITARILPGIQLDDLGTALIVAIVLGLINTFIKPILIILTLPINLMTLGLFTFVVNALLILLVSNIVPGFSVSSFWTALLFSIVLSIVSGILNKLT